MRNISAVTYPVGPSRFQICSKWVVLICASLVQLTWWIQSPENQWRHLAGMILWSVPALFIIRETIRPVTGILRWTGSEWNWESKGEVLEGAIVAQLDLQSKVFLAFKSHRRLTTWLWISAKSDPARWVSLRHAIWSIRSPDGHRENALANPP